MDGFLDYTSDTSGAPPSPSTPSLFDDILNDIAIASALAEPPISDCNDATDSEESYASEQEGEDWLVDRAWPPTNYLRHQAFSLRIPVEVAHKSDRGSEVVPAAARAGEAALCAGHLHHSFDDAV